MWPNDADGNAIRAALGSMLEKAGYTVVVPGAYEDGTTDYSSQIARFKAERCEIFNTFPLPPDFAVFWQQAAQQGYTRIVKIAQIAKTGIFPSQVEALGELGYNLSTGLPWGPTWPYRSAVLGMTNKQMADAYTKATGKYWNWQIGHTATLFDLGLAALRKSGNPKNKAAVSRAFRTLAVDTPLGRIDFRKGPIPGTVVNTPIIGGQWIKPRPGSKYKIEVVMTSNAGDPKVPIKAKLKPYNA
jgi:branched-chain amino acid transport system substrate-binding protein